MANNYEEWGNFDSTTHPVDAQKYVSPNWTRYVNPFWKVGSSLPSEVWPWMTFRTIQPGFDFAGISNKGGVTFVLEIFGNDESVSHTLAQNGKTVTHEPAWTLHLDLRIQHNNTGTLKEMKQGNSANLAKVHSHIEKTGFYEVLGAKFDWLKLYERPGHSETYGTAYKLGGAKFESRKLSEIGDQILEIQTFIDDYSQNFEKWHGYGDSDPFSSHPWGL